MRRVRALRSRAQRSHTRGHRPCMALHLRERDEFAVTRWPRMLWSVTRLISWTKEPIGVHRSRILRRAFKSLAKQAGRLRLSAVSLNPTARTPCSPWSWVALHALGGSRDASEDRVPGAVRCSRPVRGADGNRRAQPAAERLHGRAARGLSRSRGRAQDTAGAQAQRADHSHPAERRMAAATTAVRRRAGAVARQRITNY